MDPPCHSQLHCQVDPQRSVFQKTFCLLKSEAYLARKDSYIEQRIKNSGLAITERWKVRLTFGDVLRMYDSAIPRITSIMRFPPLFKLDMYILEGNNAINRMHRLKHRIRYKISGCEFKKGGFLHAPDSLEEACRHQSIIANRMIDSK